MIAPLSRPAASTDGASALLSVITPVLDEESNLAPLHQRLDAVLRGLGRPYEIIFVDDGSRDGSFAALETIARRDPAVRVVRLRTTFGQTAAMTAGIDHARGDVLVLIDADLQNDPADIPRLLERLEQGYDVVSGWRKARQDGALRMAFSRAANALISRVTGLALHDYGCTLKAYRAELFREFKLYGEMHRFIPAYLAAAGARVAELEVNHAPRQRGRSKYSLFRTVKVLLDLLTVKFLGGFATKPSYVFGGVGLLLTLLSFAVAAIMLWQKYFHGVFLIQSPLLLLAAILLLMGFQSILMGLLSEQMMRTYYESQGKRPYVVRQVLNG